MRKIKIKRRTSKRRTSIKISQHDRIVNKMFSDGTSGAEIVAIGLVNRLLYLIRTNPDKSVIDLLQQDKANLETIGSNIKWKDILFYIVSSIVLAYLVEYQFSSNDKEIDFDLLFDKEEAKGRAIIIKLLKSGTVFHALYTFLKKVLNF